MSNDTAIEKVNALAKTRQWQTRADSKRSFRNPDLVHLHFIWKGLTATGRLPARSGLSARLLKPFLRNLVFMEIEPDPSGSKRFRHTYVGTAITERVGEVTGRTFEDFLSADDAHQWSAFMTAADEENSEIRIVSRSYLGLGQYVLAESFVAALATDGITAGKLMSVTYFSTPDDVLLALDIARL